VPEKTCDKRMFCYSPLYMDFMKYFTLHFCNIKKLAQTFCFQNNFLLFSFTWTPTAVSHACIHPFCIIYNNQINHSLVVWQWLWEVMSHLAWNIHTTKNLQLQWAVKVIQMYTCIFLHMMYLWCHPYPYCILPFTSRWHKNIKKMFGPNVSRIIYCTL
jgi:hypothetical protein